METYRKELVFFLFKTATVINAPLKSEHGCPLRERERKGEGERERKREWCLKAK